MALPRYRIRWARIEVGSGHHRDWRCIAESKVTLWFGWSFWWPVDGARWHHSEAHARWDIDHDVSLRLPPAGLNA